MIDGGRLIERNDLRKVANRKKGVKEEKVRRKEKQGVKVFHGLRATSGYCTCAGDCGCMVRASLTPSAAIKVLFLTDSTRK